MFPSSDPYFCNGVNPHGHIPTLKQGDRIRITGKWVQDIGYPKPDHPQWNEIHPVEDETNSIQGMMTSGMQNMSQGKLQHLKDVVFCSPANEKMLRSMMK